MPTNFLQYWGTFYPLSGKAEVCLGMANAVLLLWCRALVNQASTVYSPAWQFDYRTNNNVAIADMERVARGRARLRSRVGSKVMASAARVTLGRAGLVASCTVRCVLN